MRTYIAYTRRIAAETPPTRNRIIDFWRVFAILVVVLGHWLAAAIWVKGTGEVTLNSSLQFVSYGAWVTWLVQVMPIFFLVGGYANAKALHRARARGQHTSDWIAARIRRLFTPVVPLIVLWTLLVLLLRPFIEPEIVQAASRSGTIMLWFIAVYLLIVGVAPLTLRWWERHRWGSIAALAAAALLVDIIRFAGVPGIGWTNFIFVWATIHQIGYWWATRDSFGKPVPERVGWFVMTGMLAVLVAVTTVGWYPVAMVRVTSETELTNMIPPTFAMLLLGVAQAGLIWATQRRVASLVSRAGAWHAVVALSGVIMTLYLWHLTAMSIVAATGLFTFDGAAFRIEPGTMTWWLTRPLWLGVLAAVTTVLLALFARFEWQINTSARATRSGVVILALVVCATAAAVTAKWDLAGPDASINWLIPMATVSGALLIGAYPSRRLKGSGSVEPRSAPQKSTAR